MSEDHFIVLEEAELRDLGTVLDQVEDACSGRGVPASVVFDVKLAVEEVCANIVLHGYGRERPGWIQLRVRLDESEVVVEIRDKAPPFDPAAVPTPDLNADLGERQVGGLGWHLVRGVMDVVEHDLDPHGGNRYTLVKRFESRADGGP